ncbi:MAG: trypsin-like peptidase domain-containing protein [Patescibacteria group bacterium]|jgi:serine protease Do
MKNVSYTDELGNVVKIGPKNKIKLIAITSLGILIMLTGALGGAVTVYVLQKQGKNLPIISITEKKEKLILEESSAFIDVVKNVKPSVVSITTSQNVQDYFGQTYEQTGGGTGFIITSDGLIVTNKHVVESGSKFTVVTNDGQSYPAEVKAIDPSNDLAVIKIDAKGLPVVNLGDSSKLEVGQWVLAIGNALGEYQNTVTVGVISAKDRAITAEGTNGSERLEGLLQTDTAINSGNSGGPLLNLAGEVVGINTAVAAKTTAEGIGFAIPTNTIISAIDSVKKTGKIIRPYLGVSYINVTKELAKSANLAVDHGALIYRSSSNGSVAVVPGGPADKAGIAENDIIVSINGEDLSETNSLRTVVAQYAPGDEVEVVYYNKGEKKTVKVKLEESKSSTMN